MPREDCYDSMVEKIIESAKRQREKKRPLPKAGSENFENSPSAKAPENSKNEGQDREPAGGTNLKNALFANFAPAPQKQ